MATCLAVTASACGDSGGDGNLAEWCRLGGEINAALEGGASIEDSTFDDFAAAAPDAIRDASETATEAFKASPEDALNDPDVEEAVTAIESFNESNC